jgi:hypothetical protein
MTDQPCCPDEITKADPCWEGYVQRGMKEGENGQMVPNCVPVEKADEASVQTSDVPENPSNSLNPSVGIKKPQYLNHDPKNANCKCDKCIKPKSLFSDFGKDHTKSQRLI